MIDNKIYWWRGANKKSDQAPAICVNPLTWRQDGAAQPQENPGSLPFPQPPFAQISQSFNNIFPHLTGAVCKNGLLEVDVARTAPNGFRDGLSLLSGSYHLNDYGMFYNSLRNNAVERVQAWRTAKVGGKN